MAAPRPRRAPTALAVPFAAAAGPVGTARVTDDDVAGPRRGPRPSGRPSAVLRPAALPLLPLLAVACSHGARAPEPRDAGTDSPAATTEAPGIAYHLEWPTPNLVAKARGRYGERLGTDPEWVSFASGTEMTRAMRAGRVDIAYGQGMAPFAAAANAGAPIRAVAVAALYPANPCVVRDGSGIDAAGASGLEGRAVAVALGTLAEYSFRRQMTALGVDRSALRVVDQDPAEAAASLAGATVDLACLFDPPSIEAALEHGAPLMTDDELRSAGIVAFDVVAVTDRLAETDPGLVERFLDVTDEANRAFSGTRTELELVAGESRLSAEEVRERMSELRFPSAAVQVDDYMGEGGLVEQALEVAAEVFSPTAADRPIPIDPSFLR